MDTVDSAIGLSSQGDPDDLALAASLFPDAKIFAALRMSKQVKRVSSVTLMVMAELGQGCNAELCWCCPCLFLCGALCICATADRMKNTLYIITDQGIVTVEVDHKLAGCYNCRNSKDYIEIRYESITLIEEDTTKICWCRKVPNIHIIANNPQPTDHHYYFEEPEKVVKLIHQLKERNPIQQQPRL